jgi:hypothetical protein
LFINVYFFIPKDNSEKVAAFWANEQTSLVNLIITSGQTSCPCPFLPGARYWHNTILFATERLGNQIQGNVTSQGPIMFEEQPIRENDLKPKAQAKCGHDLQLSVINCSPP